ncbi:peptidase associated/transthyretin-like domain-containing protein [Niabella aquatica]
MLIRAYILLFLTLLISASSSGQGRLIGKVNNYMYDSIAPLPFATVTNTTSGETARSDQNGYYSIKAREKDQVIFSNINFTSDTITVEEQLLVSGYDAALIEKSLFLSNVTVQSSYSIDSMQRRKEYQHAFEKPVGITGSNTPAAGAGIVLSPISHFSKEAKQDRRLRKRLLKEEEEHYIDYVFSAARVSALTGLQNDSLQTFMYTYRPSYKLARKLDHTGMTVYINNKFQEFKKRNSVKTEK